MPAITRKRRLEDDCSAGARPLHSAIGTLPVLGIDAFADPACRAAEYCGHVRLCHGHWLTGTGMLVAAYGISLVVVYAFSRLFKFQLNEA